MLMNLSFSQKIVFEDEPFEEKDFFKLFLLSLIAVNYLCNVQLILGIISANYLCNVQLILGIIFH